ncbi:hypothetical protein M8994_22585, partial [Brucella sp. 21LCYQ03]|nr:hypothetical protein [Brucella sp. 21LCYQ03]
MTKSLLWAVIMLSVGFKGWAQESLNTPGKSTDSLSNVFTLGEVQVFKNKRSPLFNSVPAHQIQQFAKNDVGKALNLLPGVTLSQIGPRNEALIH